MPDERILVDSDAFIGLQIKQDAHHQNAVDTFAKIRARRLQPVATTLVIAETTNLLSRRYSMLDAKRFLKTIEKIEIIVIDKYLHQQSVSLFYAQTKSKTSLVDMANVVVMEYFHIPQIFAFDTVYKDNFTLDYLH